MSARLIDRFVRLPALITPRVRRGVRIALVALVIAYGALLRFDAITLTYGPVDRPGWLRAIQQSRPVHSALRPNAVTWEPIVGRRYISDPFTYLEYAREMRSFYAAHRREPMFPFVVKVFLKLLHQQDVAVSMASACFSVLAIWATFLLGEFAFSYTVGLFAALGFAIEYDVVSWSTGGWRDDAFTFAVVFSAYAMLRLWRQPTRWNAVLLGAAGGVACLVRITSLSFLVPGLVVLLLMSRQSWKARTTIVAIAAATMVLLVAPFLINCWRTFGDPLYSINVHADVYRATEGQQIDSSMTAGSYIQSKARSRPFETLDTVVLGMTSYPFLNKWHGFDPWATWLAAWMSTAALIGLVIFVGSPPGRLLLVVLVTSLVPYAVTWRLISDWRFTEHAYPFFLVAACLTIIEIVRLASPSRLRAIRRRGFQWRPIAAWAGVLATIGLAVVVVVRVLPILTTREAFRLGENVTIAAGDRDESFFVDGWAGPVQEGNVTSRASIGQSVVRVLLPIARGFDMTVRLDPFPRPAGNDAADLPSVRVFVNNQFVALIDLGWNPQRFGAYDIHPPQAVWRQGFNRVMFLPAADRPIGANGNGFKIWYVRMRPRAADR